jgi:predicted small secreted protein
MAMMKRLVALFVLSAVALLAAGCNTVEGLGKDVKAAGSGIEKAAEKTKPY